MIQAQSFPAISGNTLIFWEFGRPDETVAAVIKHPSGKTFLLVAAPADRNIDPNFDEEAFRNTLRTFLIECELNALWIEYELPDGTQEGEELVLCPVCLKPFVFKSSLNRPQQLDYAELSIPGQVAFLREHFGHNC